MKKNDNFGLPVSYMKQGHYYKWKHKKNKLCFYCSKNTRQFAWAGMLSGVYSGDIVNNANKPVFGKFLQPSYDSSVDGRIVEIRKEEMFLEML